MIDTVTAETITDAQIADLRAFYRMPHGENRDVAHNRELSQSTIPAVRGPARAWLAFAWNSLRDHAMVVTASAACPTCTASAGIECVFDAFERLGSDGRMRERGGDVHRTRVAAWNATRRRASQTPQVP